MKNLTLILAALSFFIIVTTSCGTLTGKAKRKIVLHSNQNVGYATVNVDGEEHRNVTFPFAVKVSGKNNPSRIVATANGSQAQLNVNKKFATGTGKCLARSLLPRTP